MKHRLNKVILGAVVLFISPIITAALLGSIFILIQVIGGSTFSIAYHSLLTIIEKLKTYLLYLTLAPVLFVIFTVMMKMFIRKK